MHVTRLHLYGFLCVLESSALDRWMCGCSVEGRKEGSIPRSRSLLSCTVTVQCSDAAFSSCHNLAPELHISPRQLKALLFFG
jgi:hypothetical protein